MVLRQNRTVAETDKSKNFDQTIFMRAVLVVTLVSWETRNLYI